MTSSEQMTGISEMASIMNSAFYPYYKYLLALTIVFGAVGLISFRIKIPDIILAVYGMRLPLMVARGMAFMSIFTIPLVAQSFDGILQRIREYLDKREEAGRKASMKASMKAVKGKETVKKKQGGPAGTKENTAASSPVASVRHFRLPLVLAWLVFLGSVGYGSYFIRKGTLDTVENGIGLTEHKFSLKSGEFLRNLDIKGNMFNFFDLGGFIEWQVFPQKLTFIDGRSGITFQDHQFITGVAGNPEDLFDKYNITYIVTKTVDSSGTILPLIGYLAKSPKWELVFADGLAVVFVRNILENKRIIENYRISKNILGQQIISELLHSIFLGVDKFYIYASVGSIYMNLQDYANALKYFTMARKIHDTPQLAEVVSRLGVVPGDR
jgi:hypothetical protein